MLLGLAALGDRSAQAESVQYFGGTTQAGYRPLLRGTPVVWSFDADQPVHLVLPFAFAYYEGHFRDVFVSQRGLVSFVYPDAVSDNLALDDGGAPRLAIAPFWDALVAPRVLHGVEGTAPNRVWTLEWADATPELSHAAGQIKMQLRLYEGPEGRFEVHYGDAFGVVDREAWSGSPGYTGADAGAGRAFLSCAPDCDGTDLEALAETVFWQARDRGPDVVPAQFAYEEMAGGLRFEVEVASRYRSPLGPVDVAFYLAPPEGGDMGEPVAVAATAVLDAYGSDALTFEVPADAVPPGARRAVLLVDASEHIDEVDEFNNRAVLAELIRVEQWSNDFSVQSVASSTVVAEDAALSIEFAWQRRPSAAGIACAPRWRAYLSANMVLATQDILLAEDALPGGDGGAIERRVSLPAGLAAGRYFLGVVVDANETCREADERNNLAWAPAPVHVVAEADAPALRLPLPPAHVHLPYAHHLTEAVAPGDGWRLRAPLPPGLYLSATEAAILGRPEQSGTYPVALEWTRGDAVGQVDATLTVGRYEGPLTIAHERFHPAVVGTPYPPEALADVRLPVGLLVAGASGPLSVQVEGALPPGLTMAADGRITGRAQSPGHFAFVVTVSAGGEVASRPMQITVVEPGRLSLLPGGLPPGRLGEPYRARLHAHGGDEASAIAFSALDPLPPGLVMTSAGQLLGTPVEVGRYVFRVEVSQSNAPEGAQVDRDRIVLAVEPDRPIGIEGPTAAVLREGAAAELAFAALGGQAPFLWQVETLAPELGLKVRAGSGDGATLVIAGAPRASADTVTVAVAVTDAAGRRAVHPLALRVEAVAAAPEPPAGCRGVHSGAMAGRGGTGPGWMLAALAWLIAGGRLRSRRDMDGAASPGRTDGEAN